MSVSKSNHVSILDLPDEILEFILNKLKTVDMCYALIDVNQRFNRIIFNSRYIHDLNFAIESITNRHSSMCNDILNRICEEILPRIHQKLTKLTLEPFSIKRVIGTVDYPQLYSLSFVNFQPEILLQHLTDQTMLRLLTNQIKHIMVDIDLGKRKVSSDNESNLFEFILSNTTHLNDLVFLQNSFDKSLTLSYLITQNRIFLSSTLTKLTIHVNDFNDCLYLLNGCLQSLSTLIIRINENSCSSLVVDNTKKLLQLKCFSLTTDSCTFDYDKFYVPLLQRMLNLEELTLFLCVIRIRKQTYIDGDQLDEEVLKYMLKLKKFIFSIFTQVSLDFRREIDLQSTDDIRNSFIKRGIKSIDAYSDSKYVYGTAKCHVYSLPYQFNDLLFMNNSFQGGRFDNVRSIFMEDIRPFEHEFFEIISQNFPFLQKLILLNQEPQRNKQDESSTLVIFNHLFELELCYVDPDYVKQFLSDKITRLPCLTNLKVGYHQLVTLTNNFTNDTARLNCAKVKYLNTYASFTETENFHSYFPSLCK